jgi:citrate lyase subunit alpha/citrate CoA-transferase
MMEKFTGAFATEPQGTRYAPQMKRKLPHSSKLLHNLEEAFQAIPVQDGMTLSFHHHLRNGDAVLNMVLDVAARLGLKDLTIATSAVFPVHAPLVEHIQNGVVTAIDTNYISGPVAKAVSHGMLAKPVMFRTHGGRARAIESGDLKIDVAFIAAPTADDYGNLNGVDGPSACGSLGYADSDATYAEHVVAVTDHLVDYPAAPISIDQTRVDYVVVVDSIGDPQGIVSGTTKMTKSPVSLCIAEMAAKVIDASGLLVDGFSFQTGAGGASLATAAYVRKLMEKKKIVGSFALGGITKYMVDMQRDGLFKRLLDAQSFDLDAVKSIAEDADHLEISDSMYANPFNSGCVVNKLDVTVLGATEIDTKFNVNVVTGSTGLIMGGSGGHSDAAAGAKLTVIVTPLMRKRMPIIVDAVTTISTPGETIDVVVTERGVAVNPLRQELRTRLLAAGIPVVDIKKLQEKAEAMTGKPKLVPHGKRVVAYVEYRDGTIIDEIYETMNQ